ncbi:expressed protein [Phakopsora pachyrhizi]|uniref:Expressed protein n=1 Tax=Phakopsora pachyrhizi TaxID=170000 RepID=A0AAV0AIC7_PHAPC|nr:expressed protein [Phakopsora pachyrhizi]
MKANPESVPPSPPNSSDLAPPNRLGLHPDQQSSSGLATELPPLYFRSNVDDSSKVESNSDPNQYRARDEDLPRADLIASTSSLPYAMDASDTQSTAENLTMFSSSHPRSENTDYMPSVERLSTAASSSAYTALEPPSRYHAKSHDEFYVRRPDGVPISAGTVNKSSFYNSNNSNDVHHSEYEFNPHDNQHKSPELHESQSAAFPSTNAAEARNSIANIGLAYRSPDNRNSLLNMNNSGYSSMNEGKTTNAGAFRKHNLGGVAAAATGSPHSASPTENLQNRMAGVSLSDDYEGDSKRGSIAPLNIHKHPHSPPNYLNKTQT